MIATILPSSPTFHAVAYNESKVSKGNATLLEIKNFGPISTFGYSSPDELTQYLIEYSSCNSRIKQPQFHLAISCKGKEYTHEQLVDIAHEYLKEMGYGDPGQPLLIYGHTDTDNNHIHVITSRVNPDGRKIRDSNERRKSQKVLEKLMNTNLKDTAEKDVKTAMEFDFRNINQFKAVMEAMNYECFEKNGVMYVKKGGCIRTKVEISTIKGKAERNNLSHKNNVAENARWRSIFKKYRDTNCNRMGLEKDLKKLFGLSLVFFGKKDSPYGYFAVDFNKKRVLEGGKILGVNDLLDFRTPEQHMEEIEEFINIAFEQNPQITTKDLNYKLRRLGAYVKKNSIIFGQIRKSMAEGHQAILDRNNKIKWRDGFKPQTPEERDLLCKLTGWSYPDLITVASANNGKYYCKDYEELTEIFKIEDISERAEALDAAGFKLVAEGDEIYAFRAGTQSLTNLQKAGFDGDLYEPLLLIQGKDVSNNNMIEKIKQESSPKIHRPVIRTDKGGGSHYANREDEVGRKGKDRDDLDRKGSVSY